MDLDIATDGAVMTLAADIKPEIRAAADEELPPGYPREKIGLLPGDGDEYIITSGGMRGMRGFFTRDDSGAVVGIDAGQPDVPPGIDEPPGKALAPGLARARTSPIAAGPSDSAHERHACPAARSQRAAGAPGGHPPNWPTSLPGPVGSCRVVVSGLIGHELPEVPASLVASWWSPGRWWAAGRGCCG